VFSALQNRLNPTSTLNLVPCNISVKLVDANIPHSRVTSFWAFSAGDCPLRSHVFHQQGCVTATDFYNACNTAPQIHLEALGNLYSLLG
jgi:hypothetical protein